MIQETLVGQYGTMGIFIAYLIYDRQVVMKRIMQALDRIARKLD
jgi:hypothetical protein